MLQLTKLALWTSGLFFTSYFRSPQLAETCDESQSGVSSLVTLLSSVSDLLPPRICEFSRLSQTSVISVPDFALADRVLKIQNGRHKTQKHAR